MSHRAETCSLE